MFVVFIGMGGYIFIQVTKKSCKKLTRYINNTCIGYIYAFIVIRCLFNHPIILIHGALIFGTAYIEHMWYMQVLFIAPVHGKKKPQLSYPYEVIDNDNSINNLETIKQNSEFLNRTLDFARGRLENVVRRPKRSGSKVYLCVEDSIMLSYWYCLYFVACRHQIHALVQKNVYWCSDGALLLLRWLRNMTTTLGPAVWW